MTTLRTTLVILLLPAAMAQAQAPSVAPAPASASQRATETIRQLGEANGQALACGLTDSAATAKALMLKHSPRTADYGKLYEDATQAGFRAQVGGKTACPRPVELAIRIEGLAHRLREALPTTGD